MLVRPLQPENALPPMLVTPSGIITLVRPLQPENALPPMLVTLSGIFTSPLTPMRTVVPSLFNTRPLADEYCGLPAATEMFVSSLQPSKSQRLMLVTPFPIVTLVRPLQSENAPYSMLVTLSGIVTSPLTPLRMVVPSLVSNRPLADEYCGFPDATEKKVRWVHPRNASYSMRVTLSGIVTSPLTPFRIVVPSLFNNKPLADEYCGFPAATEKEVRLVQLENAPHSMFVTLSGIVTLVRLLQSRNASPMLVTPFGIVTSPLTPFRMVVPF